MASGRREARQKKIMVITKGLSLHSQGSTEACTTGLRANGHLSVDGALAFHCAIDEILAGHSRHYEDGYFWGGCGLFWGSGNVSGGPQPFWMSTVVFQWARAQWQRSRGKVAKIPKETNVTDWRPAASQPRMSGGARSRSVVLRGVEGGRRRGAEGGRRREWAVRGVADEDERWCCAEWRVGGGAERRVGGGGSGRSAASQTRMSGGAARRVGGGAERRVGGGGSGRSAASQTRMVGGAARSGVGVPWRRRRG